MDGKSSTIRERQLSGEQVGTGARYLPDNESPVHHPMGMERACSTYGQQVNEAEAHVKCPKCGVDLVPAIRHKIKVNSCQSCKGMWLEHDELEELEDEVFDFGDRWKGSLVFSSAATTHKCPECTALLQRFSYRLYDLEMEFCPNQHGYWLDDDEDTRVLELMKIEEADLQRKLLAEDKWAATLKHLRSPSFFSNLRDLFHK